MFYSFIHPACCNCPTRFPELDSWCDMTAPHPVLRSVTRMQLVESSPTRPLRTTLHNNGRNSGEIRCSATSGDMLFMVFTPRCLWRHSDTLGYKTNTQNALFITIKRGGGKFPFKSRVTVHEDRGQFQASLFHLRWQCTQAGFLVFSGESHEITRSVVDTQV